MILLDAVKRPHRRRQRLRRSSPGLVRAGRLWRYGILHRPPQRSATPATSRRRAGRLRRNPFGSACAALSERGAPCRAAASNGAVSSRPNLSWAVAPTSRWGSATSGRWSTRSAGRLADRGRSRINWVTVLGRQSASGEPAAWDRKVPKDRFFPHFKDWNFEWIKFADLICRTDEIYEYPHTIATPCRAGVLAA